MKWIISFLIILATSIILQLQVSASGNVVPEAAMEVRTHFNALLLNYNPQVIHNGILKTVTEAFGMREIQPLTADYIDALRKASGGQVNWHVTETFDLVEFPPENDPNVTYTPENYMYYYDIGYGMLGLVDYVSIITDPRFDIITKVESGEIDAVWVFAFRGAGFWETAMAGEGAYWINGSPITGVDCSKRFVIYGFGHEAHQHYGFMLENTGHMIENIFLQRGNNWPKNWTLPIWNSFDLNSPERYLVDLTLADWQRFFLSDALNYNAPDRSTGLGFLSSPENSQVGTVHFPPNATFNYGWPMIEESFRSDNRWISFGGNWAVVNEEYKVEADNGVKSLMHDGIAHRPFSMSEFVAEGEVSVANDASPSHAGILFRMEKFSTGPNQGQGYYAAIDAYHDEVLLYKMDYGLTKLASATLTINADTVYRIKISVIEQNIKIYLENQSVPLIDITDNSFQTGGFGVCAYHTAASFDNINANVTVKCQADRWYTYPALDGFSRPVNSIDWSGAHEEYLSWWFEHIPKNPGTHDDGILNTWWPYIFDINRFDPLYRYTDVSIPKLDDISPEAPKNLKVLELSSFSLKLIWEEPADNIGVTRYDIYREGEFVQQSSSTSFEDKGLYPDTIYQYEVEARDGSGNVSSSTSIEVRTLLYNPEGLQNGDFEQGVADTVSYWTTDVWKPAESIMIWEPIGEGHQGSRSVSIENTEDNDSRWIQVVSGLIPGMNYRLSGLIKGQDVVNVTGTTGANLCLFGTWEHTPGLNGTFDWTEVSMTFAAPANGIAVIGCRLGFWGNTTTGKVWFDNISLGIQSSYTAVPPCRIVDTRKAGGIIGASTQRDFHVFGSGSTINAQGGNSSGCPSPLGEPLAAHLNIIVVNPTGKGNLQAYAVGAGPGFGLSVNYNTIDTNLANAGTVKTSPDITVASNFSSAHTVIDVLGYYYPDGELLYTAVNPCRIADTRKTSAGIIDADTQRNFRVFGSGSTISAQGGNSAGCSSPLGEPHAAHINMVAVDPTGKGNLQAFPVDAGAGAGLSVNYNTIDTNLANAGTVKTVTGSGPDISVASNFSSAHTVIDVLGYYYPDGDLLYTAVPPCRIVDTRKAGGLIGASTQRDFHVYGSGSTINAQGGNSAGCSAPMGEPLAAQINMVAVNPTGKGNLQAYAVGAGPGAGLSVNYNTIDTNLANAGTVKTVTGAGPDISVASNFSSAHTVIDVLGYYYPAP